MDNTDQKERVDKDEAESMEDPKEEEEARANQPITGDPAIDTPNQCELCGENFSTYGEFIQHKC